MRNTFIRTTQSAVYDYHDTRTAHCVPSSHLRSTSIGCEKGGKRAGAGQAARLARCIQRTTRTRRVERRRIFLFSPFGAGDDKHHHGRPRHQLALRARCTSLAFDRGREGRTARRWKTGPRAFCLCGVTPCAPHRRGGAGVGPPPLLPWRPDLRDDAFRHPTRPLLGIAPGLPQEDCRH